MKPTAEEIRKAIDTIVDFSMFTQSGKIGKIALKAAKLTFSRKNDFLTQRFYTGFYMCLYFYIDLKYEMCLRFIMRFIFFHNLVKSDVFKKPDFLSASFNQDSR